MDPQHLIIICLLLIVIYLLWNYSEHLSLKSYMDKSKRNFKDIDGIVKMLSKASWIARYPRLTQVLIPITTDTDFPDHISGVRANKLYETVGDYLLSKDVFPEAKNLRRNKSFLEIQRKLTNKLLADRGYTGEELF